MIRPFLIFLTYLFRNRLIIQIKIYEINLLLRHQEAKMFDNIFLVKENNENTNIFQFFTIQLKYNLPFDAENKHIYSIWTII
jgi:hypothetical protein